MILDLNCDLGEGCGSDAELIPLISSANVSCGAHAGTPKGIVRTLQCCREHGVTVGAHPGHADPEHFGRRELLIPPRDVLEETFQQIQRLRLWGVEVGTPIRYVKPHGALYHQANSDDAYADAIVCAAAMADLPVVGLPGSRLERRATGKVRFIAEGFADRRYRPDGGLVPRSEPNAMIESATEAITQAVSLVKQRLIQTVCVHGDHPKAIEFVKALRAELLQQSIQVKSFA